MNYQFHILMRDDDAGPSKVDSMQNCLGWNEDEDMGDDSLANRSSHKLANQVTKEFVLISNESLFDRYGVRRLW